MEKSTNMKGRNFFKIALIIVVAASSLLVLRSAIPANKAESCKELMEDCSKKKDTGADKMIWDNLSQQFFSAL